MAGGVVQSQCRQEHLLAKCRKPGSERAVSEQVSGGTRDANAMGAKTNHTFHDKWRSGSKPIAAWMSNPACENPSAGPRMPGVKSTTAGLDMLLNCRTRHRSRRLSKSDDNGVQHAVRLFDVEH